MVGALFRRLYSTPASPISNVTRLAKAPLAVRIRRIRAGNTEFTEDGLSPNQHERYKRLVKLGRISEKLSPAEWLAREDVRRQRIRGMRTTKVDGQKKVEVVGQPIYLPNVKFILMRNATAPGEPYNPYHATFRVPLSFTKTDIRSYLQATYGVATTYIRTEVFHPDLPGIRGRKSKKKAFKRAIVGLVDPFYYPNADADLTLEEKTKQADLLEEHFQVKLTKSIYHRAMLESVTPNQYGTVIKDINNLGRDKILEKIAERRNKREGLVSETVQSWRKKRGTGESISLVPAPAKDIASKEKTVVEEK